MFEIVDVPDKGRGVRATRPIPRGTLIMAEKPLIRIRTGTSLAQAQAAYDALAPAERAIIDMMRSNVPRRTILDVLKSHGVPTGDSRTEAALYANVCFANHSCVPNAIYYFDPRKDTEVIHALVDIAEGAEILVSYGENVAETSRERQDYLRAGFKFDCRCTLCSSSPAEIAASDERRAAYKKLVDFFPTGMQREPVSALALLARTFQILKEESLWYDESSRYYDGFQACAAWGDLANARAWAAKAKEAHAVSRGADGEKALEMAARERDPRTHRLWAVLGRKTLCGPPVL